MRLLFRLQEAITERRCDGAGNEERGEQGDGDREGQRDEQEPRDTHDEKHGQEDDDGRDRRGEDRHGHFAGGVDDGIPAVPVDVQMTLNVFQFHDGVVHQPADAQRQPAHREDIQRLVAEIEDDKGHENRQRNGDGDDQRAGQVPQKQQNDRRREQRAMEGLLDEVFDRLPDIDRLIEGDAQLHAGRNADHFGNGLP